MDDAPARRPGEGPEDAPPAAGTSPDADPSRPPLPGGEPPPSADGSPPETAARGPEPSATPGPDPTPEPVVPATPETPPAPVLVPDPDPAAARKGPRPRVSIDHDTRRSRVLVLLRLPLAVPHLIWWWLWSGVVGLVLPVAWLLALVLGRLPRPLHRLLRAYVRYTTHLTSFLTLAANPFPGFLGTLPYPVDVRVGEPVRQPRLSLLVRFVTAIPALVVLYALDVVRWVVVPVAWLIALVAGRLPSGLVEVLVYVARFQALTHAYLLLLTRRYPTFGGDDA